MVHLEFKTIKPILTTNSLKSKYDILISCSLFKMKESYKNFKGDYLNKFLKWIPYVPKNSYIRLYIDSSVIEDPNFQQIIDANISNLEIVQFYSEDFFIPSDIENKFSSMENSFPLGYHDGTFGSIIRFYPLFVKPDVKYIWITDVDMSPKFFDYKNIKALQMNNAKVLYHSKSCYDKPWTEGIRYPVIASKIIMNSKIELNKANFTRYLNDILKGKYKTIFNTIKKKFEEEGAKQAFKDIHYFPYGFDELFLNKYLHPIFQNYRRVIIFEMVLDTFLKEKIVEIPNKDKKLIISTYFKSWEWKLKPYEYKVLLKNNEHIFNQVKNIDFTKLNSKKVKVLELCKRDYEENKKFINVSEGGFDNGVSLVLVKKANEV